MLSRCFSPVLDISHETQSDDLRNSFQYEDGGEEKIEDLESETQLL